MRDIGKTISEEFKEEYFKKYLPEHKGTLLNPWDNKLIRMEEFYTPDSDTTLDWENLGIIRRKEIKTRGIGLFEDLLYHLILPLSEKGEYSDYLQEGFYGIVNTGSHYFFGIEGFSGREPDFHGRRYPTPVTFYPKRKADVEGYMKTARESYGKIVQIVN